MSTFSAIFMCRCCSQYKKMDVDKNEKVYTSVETVFGSASIAPVVDKTG